jgi:DNA-directed RNA polymerase specialized sigma subunit
VNELKKFWKLQDQERKGGRPSLPDHKKREIKFLYDEQKLTGEEIAKRTGVSRSTVYRVIKLYDKLEKE